MTFADNAITKFLEINDKNYWQVLKLARMCVRYVNYDLANQLYDKMANKMIYGSYNMSANDLRYFFFNNRKNYAKILNTFKKKFQKLVRFHVNFVQS